MESNMVITGDDATSTPRIIIIEQLSQLLQTYGMSKAGFSRFCFRLLAGEKFSLGPRIVFGVRNDFYLNETVTNRIDEHFIQHYLDTEEL